jgi:predicted DNA-binding transcriptional regulator AlpA
MANPAPKRATDSAPVFWVEQEIDRWIKSKIRGQEWVPAEHDQPTFIRKPQVLRRVGLSYPTVWKLEKFGRFPRRYRLDEVVEPADAA